MSHGCPHWPGCGCGTQSGPHVCEWKRNRQAEETSDALMGAGAIIAKLQETIKRQAAMIEAQAKEIARLQPLKGVEKK